MIGILELCRRVSVVYAPACVVFVADAETTLELTQTQTHTQRQSQRVVSPPFVFCCHLRGERIGNSARVIHVCCFCSLCVSLSVCRIFMKYAEGRPSQFQSKLTRLIALSLCRDSRNLSYNFCSSPS